MTKNGDIARKGRLEISEAIARFRSRDPATRGTSSIFTCSPFLTAPMTEAGLAQSSADLPSYEATTSTAVVTTAEPAKYEETAARAHLPDLKNRGHQDQGDGRDYQTQNTQPPAYAESDASGSHTLTTRTGESDVKAV